METIVFSNLNETELLRSLSRYGKDSFNVHVLNAYKLAKEALIRSGVLYKEKEIDTTEQVFIINKLIKNINYFKKSSFIDSKHIVKSLNKARLLCRGNEENKLQEVLSGGEFIDKNKAILDTYLSYQEYKNNNHLIDAIDIINLALLKANVINSNFIVFKEKKMFPLEEELINKVSSTYKTFSISEYLNLKKTSSNDITYDNAYGQVNEVEHILSYIGENKIAFEDCLISVIDNSYINQLKAYKDMYNLKMTFKTGISISNSNAYKLLVDIKRWEDSFNNSNCFEDLLEADEFNKDKFLSIISDNKLSKRDIKDIIKQVGNLKLSIQDNKEKLDKYKSTNSKLFEVVNKIAQELSKGYGYFIREYTNIVNENIDIKAVENISLFVDEYYENIKDANLSDVLEEISTRYILKEQSKAGHLHVSDLNGALEVSRKHLFICGLNAKSFPGSPKEDYLLLDSDLERFNEENINDSNSKIQNNKQLLIDVINKAIAQNTYIHLSYAGYNLAELKEENPSSMLYEIYKSYDGKASSKSLEEKIGEQHKYFDANISSLKEMGINYLNGIDYITGKKEKDIVNKINLTKELSPSVVEKYFDCPKRFYLTAILGVEEKEVDNPFIVIPANDEGDLIHECMEDYGNNPKWTKEEFETNARKKINNYFNSRIPLHNKKIDEVINNFMDMAKEGYTSDPHNEIYKSEYDVGPYKDSNTGLIFKGRVDRIEKLENGKYVIVDYKTYKEIKNETNDINTCFQVVLYAYLLEQTENKEIEKCEYRYLRNPDTIECVYNEAIKEQLKSKLLKLKESLDTGVFELAQDKDKACKYCTLSSICGVNKKGDE